jgi:GNAT superfamily N-acetyltransferase
VSSAYSKYVDRIGRPPGPLLDDYQVSIDDRAVWVLVQADVIRGVLVLLEETDHLLLQNVAVDPLSQGIGYGRLLIDFAEQEARRRGRREIRLYTNQLMHENIAMYLRLGYEETDRGEEGGYRRVFFRKLLG